jgi:cytochrome c oxidase subunit II
VRTHLGLVIVAACGGAPAKPLEPAKPPEPVANAQDEIVVLASAPPDAIVLEVRAIRWACAVTHARGVVTPDLTVPAGRPIKLIVTTPEWPAQAKGLAVSLVGTNVDKPIVKDAPVEIAFRLDKPGTYHWKCPTLVPPKPAYPIDPALAGPEYLAQLDPVKPLVTVTDAEYRAMLDANDLEVPANRLALGAKLYQRKGCVSCHTIDGSPRVGPSWQGIWGSEAKLSDGSTRTVDADYVKESVLHPQAFARPGYPPVMPSFEGQIRDQELAALIAYIESLR